MAAVFLVGFTPPAVMLALSGLFPGESFTLTEEAYAKYSDFTARYGKIADFDSYIRENYYLPIEEGVLETGACKGQFSSLGDAYTVYYTA